MKILDLKEFLELPAGTIYSDYVPAICTGLFRKGKSCALDNGEWFDFFNASVIAECWDHDHRLPSVDDAEGRWGMYDNDAQFAVYEPADLEVMRRLLFGADAPTVADSATDQAETTNIVAGALNGAGLT